MEIHKARISKRTVDALDPPATGESRLWDTDVQGFFLRAYASGRRVYAIKYRAGSLQRVHTLGVHGSPLTPETARRAAVEVLGRVRAGEDPALEKKAARNALTVNALIDRYLTDGPATKLAKRASTWAIDASNLKRHIRPLLGRKIADSVTKADAARAIRDITEGKTAVDERTTLRGRARVTGGTGTARRTRTTTAAMFAWGVEDDLVKTNPFAGLKMTASPMRERFLSREEAGRFLDALNAMEAETILSQSFADALRILLLTGARKTEVLGLRWREVDFERRLLVLPPDRTKAGGSSGQRRITLSPAALTILSRRKTKTAEPDDFVFPASRGDGHVIGLRRAFVKACAVAGLEGVRIHDLRHSFASFAIADGASLYLVSKLLGHASARTTERYAHLGGDPLQDVAAMIGRRLVGVDGTDGPKDGGPSNRTTAPVGPSDPKTNYPWGMP